MAFVYRMRLHLPRLLSYRCDRRTTTTLYTRTRTALLLSVRVAVVVRGVGVDWDLYEYAKVFRPLGIRWASIQQSTLN